MMRLNGKTIRAVIFDCDGVVINSGEDIADAVNATLDHLGLNTLPVEQLISYTGDGARRLLCRAIAFSQAMNSASAGKRHADAKNTFCSDVDTILSGSGAVTDNELSAAGVSKKLLDGIFPWYLDCYYAHAVVKTTLYPRFAELVTYLDDNDVYVGMLTNKPEKVARAILHHFNIDSYFVKIAGPESLVHMKPDPEGVYKIVKEMNRKILSHGSQNEHAESGSADSAVSSERVLVAAASAFSVISPEQVLMVGDSAVDIQAGRSAGALTCAVKGGVGNKEKLNAEHADVTVLYAGDLIKMIY